MARRDQGRSAVARHPRRRSSTPRWPTSKRRSRPCSNAIAPQAEFTLELDQYLKRRLTPRLIRTAQDLYTQQRTLLTEIGKKYGVSPRIVVAVWGLESNFGRFAGVRPTIPALATLAYDPRRATFFRSELFAALEILNRGDIDLASLKGSWAGALGQPQFMPSSYLRYAQDYDGDGHRDIWSSPPDVFASVAYYLSEHGWSDRSTWGREVLVPKAARSLVTSVPTREEGCRAERMMSVPRTLAEWRKKGVRALGNKPLPAGGHEGLAGDRRLAVLSGLRQLRSHPGLQLRAYLRAQRGAPLGPAQIGGTGHAVPAALTAGE